ncbi:hypothetical protein ACFYM0_15970 [Streptomyces sp. NPDC006487]|uniref:hypothetical protein n=1 Tax=Streptomyces sp. NPDC006487 TaxID=3364748 RepID=UPI0036ADE625
MHDDDQEAGQNRQSADGTHRMETFERPAARTPLRSHHRTGHTPDGVGCGSNDPLSWGL